MHRFNLSFSLSNPNSFYTQLATLINDIRNSWSSVRVTDISRSLLVGGHLPEDVLIRITMPDAEQSSIELRLRASDLYLVAIGGTSRSGVSTPLTTIREDLLAYGEMDPYTITTENINAALSTFVNELNHLSTNQAAYRSRLNNGNAFNIVVLLFAESVRFGGLSRTLLSSLREHNGWGSYNITGNIISQIKSWSAKSKVHKKQQELDIFETKNHFRKDWDQDKDGFGGGNGFSTVNLVQVVDSRIQLFNSRLEHCNTEIQNIQKMKADFGSKETLDKNIIDHYNREYSFDVNREHVKELRLGMNLGGAAGKIAAKTVAKNVAEKAAAKILAKVAVKEAPKLAAKKIPIAGAIIGLGFGIFRVCQGDFVGAGMEVSSGIASTIPGVGTAGSVAIDLALAGRDITNDGDALKKIVKELAEEIVDLFNRIDSKIALRQEYKILLEEMIEILKELKRLSADNEDDTENESIVKHSFK